MARLLASIDKTTRLNAQTGGDTLSASLDTKVKLSASMDVRVRLLAEFGVGFKIFSGTWVFDKDGNQVVDMNGNSVIL